MEPPEEVSLYSLSWSYFDKNLKAAFNNPKSLRKYSDVTFLCQDTTLYAHKIILHAGSNYFRDLFEDQRANNNLIIYMFHVKGIVLKKLLEYLYCGEVQIEKKYLQEFIMLGQNLKVKGLVNCHDETSGRSKDENHPLIKRKIDKASAAIHEKLSKNIKHTSASEEDDESGEEAIADEKLADQFADKEMPSKHILPTADNYALEEKQETDEEQTTEESGKFVTKSFTRYQKLLANIKKTEKGPHEMTKGTRRRCGQCSIQKIEKRTSYFCRTCNIALCRECFDPFHKTFDSSAKIKQGVLSAKK